MKTAFSQNLNALIRERGMKQITLASELKVNSTVVSAWCRGRTVPTQKNLKRIGEFFKVETQSLFLDSEKGEPTMGKVELSNVHLSALKCLLSSRMTFAEIAHVMNITTEKVTELSAQLRVKYPCPTCKGYGINFGEK